MLIIWALLPKIKPYCAQGIVRAVPKHSRAARPAVDTDVLSCVTTHDHKTPMASDSPPPTSVIVPKSGPSVPIIRSVAGGRGATWWSEAWRLFTPAAGTWILIIVVLFLLNIVLTFIPVLGHIAGQALLPAIVAGIMLGCRAIDQGQPLTVGHLFAGFSERGGPLFVLGLIYAALTAAIAIAVLGLLFAMFGATILSQLWNLHDPLAAVTGALGSVLMAVLVGMLVFLLLYLPLVMAIWFAPALVVFRRLEPWEAMKASFAGSMRNVLPFLVYGIVGVVLAIVASIPIMLGWLVLAPVSLASVYTSYCDIYEDAGTAAASIPG